MSVSTPKARAAAPKGQGQAVATSKAPAGARPKAPARACGAPPSGATPAAALPAGSRPAPPPRTLSQALRERRGDLLAEACPSREVLKHVTSRWGVLVLMALEAGPQRFSELRRTIGGVSERMLAQTLQWLEGDGLVLRVALEVVPPHVEYSLTRLGLDAARRVRGLADWIELNVHHVLSHQAQKTQMAEQAQQAEQAQAHGTRAGRTVHRLR